MWCHQTSPPQLYDTYWRPDYSERKLTKAPFLCVRVSVCATFMSVTGADILHVIIHIHILCYWLMCASSSPTSITIEQHLWWRQRECDREKDKDGTKSLHCGSHFRNWLVFLTGNVFKMWGTGLIWPLSKNYFYVQYHALGSGFFLSITFAAACFPVRWIRFFRVRSKYVLRSTTTQ